MIRIKFWYEIFMERTVRKIVREIKFRKQRKDRNKKDPYIY
jgi:hypothetical protein